MPEAVAWNNNAITVMRETNESGELDQNLDHEYSSHDPTLSPGLPVHTDGVALAPSSDLIAETYMSDDDGYSSDEDVDMEGGVSISNLSYEHAHALNHEMNMIDAEIMGEENLAHVVPNMAGTVDVSSNAYMAQLLAHGLDPTQPNAPASPHDDDVDVWSIDEGSIDAHNVPPGQTGWGGHMGAMNDNMEDQYNLNLFDFLWSWGSYTGEEPPKGGRKIPHLPAVTRERIERPSAIARTDLQGEMCDLQGLNWNALGVTRKEAREMRKQTYTNYTNLRQPHMHTRYHHPEPIPNSENYFRFRRMDLKHRPNLSHFQLRNLLACTSRHQVFYPGRSMVYQANPFAGTKDTVIDLTDPIVQPVHSFAGGIQISTLAAAHGVLLAGGFCGEYALLNLNGPAGTKHHEGLFTEHLNSITNSISIDLSRTSGLPIATVSSNDNGLRVMDLTTQQYFYKVAFPYAMNCTAASPDQRLRVLVGDTTDVIILSTDNGEVLQKLPGHKDFGFACAWADDGIHVATGNQDQTIKIWDARKWKEPIQNLGTELAGARSLRFSPIGSGKRVLLAAEPADIVNVIDAETYASKQVLDFFGEIGGISFTPDGQEFYVASCDSARGGIIEYERTGFGETYGRVGIDDSDDEDSGVEEGFDWKPTLEEVCKDPRSMRTATYMRRKAAHMAPIGLF